jgi:hypothetical protein
MRKVIYILLIFICSLTISYAQSKNSKYYERLIQDLETTSAPDTLMFIYNNFLSTNNYLAQTEEKIIYDVFLAKILANEVEAINSESTLLYNTALSTVSKINNPELKLWVQTQVGFYYYTYNDYSKAFRYFIKTSKVLDKNINADYIGLNDILKKNAYFFLTTLDYKRSITYLKKALSISKTDSEEYASYLNSIGIAYLNLNELKKAESTLKKAEFYALQYKHEVRYAKILGDLARVYIAQNKLDKAKNLLITDIQISIVHNQSRNTMFAQLQLGSVYLKLKQINEAKQTLLEALSYAETKPYLRGYELELSKLLLKISVKEKDEKQELILRRKIDDLTNLISEIEGDEALNAVLLKNEKEKIQWQLEAEKEHRGNETLKKWFLACIIFLLLVICVLITKVYKKRLLTQQDVYEKKILEFKLDKLDSETKLSEANNSLDSFKTYLLEKNKQINVLQNEINELESISNEKSESSKSSLEKLLDSHLMTKENWYAFKKAFKEEETEFYTSIIHNYPDITDANLRIILLQKIGLTNSEIAKILGITIDGVKKAKQRLRKKYGTFQA